MAWLFVFVLAIVFPPLFLIVPIRGPGILVVLGWTALLAAVHRPATGSPAHALRGPPATR
jgi:hypothetical protein